MGFDFVNGIITSTATGSLSTSGNQVPVYFGQAQLISSASATATSGSTFIFLNGLLIKQVG